MPLQETVEEFEHELEKGERLKKNESNKDLMMRGQCGSNNQRIWRKPLNVKFFVKKEIKQNIKTLFIMF